MDLFDPNTYSPSPRILILGANVELSPEQRRARRVQASSLEEQKRVGCALKVRVTWKLVRVSTGQKRREPFLSALGQV